MAVLNIPCILKLQQPLLTPFGAADTPLDRTPGTCRALTLVVVSLFDRWRRF
jgi:hypothetical protein